jgi:uncharacterized membrane protein YvlD (DUF360 family)
MKQLFLFTITALVLEIFRYLSSELQNNFLDKPLMSEMILAILKFESLPKPVIGFLIYSNMFFWWGMFSSLVAFFVLVPLFMKFQDRKLNYYILLGLYCGAMYYPLSFGLHQPTFLGVNGHLVICVAYTVSATIAYCFWKFISLRFKILNGS